MLRPRDAGKEVQEPEEDFLSTRPRRPGLVQDLVGKAVDHVLGTPEQCQKRVSLGRA